MSEPLIVSIPHRLGKDEATRRLKVGIHQGVAQLGGVIRVDEEIWSGDRLSFRLTALRQQITGALDVMDSSVRLEITLPWLLAGLARTLQATLTRRGATLLEKK